MPYMIEHNWLVNYQYQEGIARILLQMDRRTNNESKMQYAVAELTSFYSEFEAEFTSFFPELIKHTNQKLQTLGKLDF